MTTSREKDDSATLSIGFADLLRHNALEAERWHRWLSAQPAQLLELPFGDETRRMGTVRDMLWHVFIVEWLYARVIDGRPFDDWASLKRETLDDLFSIGAQARDMLGSYCQRATAADMTEMLSLSGEGVTITGTRRKFLTHTFIHSLRHWAQIATVLRQHGHQTDWQHDFVLSDAIE